jgi:caffeoyl-CoA O-methyltransferase
VSRRSLGLSEELHDYVVAHGAGEDGLLRELAVETERTYPDIVELQIAPEQGALFTMLTRLLQPRFAVEIGTFTGYSALCIARGLPDGGRLVCFDRSPEWTAMARRYWERAGVADRIELRLGDATETLATLADDPPVDFAFIDADKPGYAHYYDTVLARLAPGGLIIADNAFAGGQVLAPDSDDAAATAAFNQRVADDPRVDVVILPVADGISLITKKPA